MDKRYQVFVSSTFTDMQEERQVVIQALLESDCPHVYSSSSTYFSDT